MPTTKLKKSVKSSKKSTSPARKSETRNTLSVRQSKQPRGRSSTKRGQLRKQPRPPFKQRRVSRKSPQQMRLPHLRRLLKRRELIKKMKRVQIIRLRLDQRL